MVQVILRHHCVTPGVSARSCSLAAGSRTAPAVNERGPGRAIKAPEGHVAHIFCARPVSRWTGDRPGGICRPISGDGGATSTGRDPGGAGGRMEVRTPGPGEPLACAGPSTTLLSQPPWRPAAAPCLAPCVVVNAAEADAAAAAVVAPLPPLPPAPGSCCCYPHCGGSRWHCTPQSLLVA